MKIETASNAKGHTFRKYDNVSFSIYYTGSGRVKHKGKVKMFIKDDGRLLAWIYGIEPKTSSRWIHIEDLTPAEELIRA